MIRVDTHFHPNFSFWLPESCIRRRARNIWETFRKRKLDMVFVSEHAFKHPRRSYEALMRYRPRNARTHLVPAVEALTKEGIDVVVFSRDTYVYGKKDILTPYRLTLEKLVARVQKDGRLYGVIAHPYVPSDSGILHHRSERTARKEERELHFVEKYNSSLVALRTVVSLLHLRGLFKRLTFQMNRTIRLPGALIPRGVIWLGGSDAHHLWDIGNCLLVHAPRPRDSRRLFDRILSPRYRRTFFWQPPRHPFCSIAADAVTDYREHLMRKLRLYGVDGIPRTEALRG
ncbi:MAG: hypothetical protein WCV62_00900 [Candidatus Peribacteraceae bacterium]|jgi:hypothetical protein